MKIIYPESNDVDQFLIDLREDSNYPSEEVARDITDKVMYLPKSLFSTDGAILSIEELREELKTNGVKKIDIYLENLIDELKSLKQQYKLKQDYNHLQTFLKVYKKSMKNRKDNLIIVKDQHAWLFANFTCNHRFYSQDFKVNVAKLPEILGNDKVLEINDIQTGPINMDEIVKKLGL